MGRALEPGPASKFQVPRLQKEGILPTGHAEA